MNFIQLENQCRYSRFMWDGKEDDLNGARGFDAMPIDLLRYLINESGVEINMELQADLEIKHNSLTASVEVLAMPTNALAIKKIVIFPDANTSGSETATSGYAASYGYPMEMVSSYETLISGQDAQVGGAFVGYTVVGGSYVGELWGSIGVPEKFMLHEQGGVLYALFNKKPDANYFVDIYYYAIPATMTVDASTPDIPTQYQGLYRHMTCRKIAEILGDQRRENGFLLSYKEKLQQMISINSKRHTPARVRFNLLGLRG